MKIIKLQGYPSEGFITPITYLYNWLTLIGKNNEVVHKVTPGTEFDSVDGEILCRKYVPKTTYTPGQPKEGGKVRKKLNRVKKVIDTQFRFHYDTTLIKKCPSVIHPNDIISITAKVHGTSGISAYVLCERPKKWYEKVFEFLTRKEVGYVPGTRTPIVEPGNLYDDLSRRDFTVNAMAKDPDTGEIIDYFGGLKDIKEKLLRTPLPPIVTFDDDPLRILRGIRFSITKRLRVSEDMWQAMKAYDYFDKMPVVSEERIREELTKCFKCNSSLTLGWLSELTDLRDYIFKNTNLWLKPTSEK